MVDLSRVNVYIPVQTSTNPDRTGKKKHVEHARTVVPQYYSPLEAIGEERGFS